MKPHTLSFLLASVVLPLSPLLGAEPAAAAPPAAAPSAMPGAAELVLQVAANRRAESILIRARLLVTDSATEGRSAIQFLLRGRTDGEVTRRLYQVLWPTPRLGQALYLERDGDGPLGGFLFEPPDKITPLSPELLRSPFLDSDLSIEDLSDDFWQWPAPTLAGTETVNGEPCAIIDLRPPAGRPYSYGRVRAWISTAKTLPLRLEKFDASERLVKRFTFRKLVQRDGIWAPATTVVQAPGSSRETLVELSRGERDASIPLAELSVDAIKQFAARAAQEAQEAAAARRGNPAHK
jgi:hypothetical protein